MKSFSQTPIFAPEGYAELDQFLQELAPSKTFILVDSNTNACLAHFSGQLPSLDGEFEILEVEPGEDSKSLEVVAGLWEVLLEYGADRNSVLINLGGGVVLDLGGFVASTFKRGIPFINVPTSLLAMVDASVGGKTGINFSGLKNQIGTFQSAAHVLIDPTFLETLPEEEWKSGHGEMIKHSLISGLNWPEVLNLNSTSLFAAHLVQSIGVKLEVVKADFQEEGLRKILNLGHTFGHAWESFRASEDKPVTHGAAVIQGLHVALKLSDQEDLRKQLAEVYPWEPFENSCFDALWERMLGDKKNRDGVVLFVLLEELAAASWDNEITKEEWERALFELNAGWEPCLSY